MWRALARRPGDVTRSRIADGIRDECSTFVEAPVDAVWAMVSDVTRMGRWSPENRAALRISWSGAPESGRWFVGFNRIGPVPWATPCEVTVVDPLRHFEFRVHLIGTRWGYRLRPEHGGTMVTEYRDWPDAAFLSKLLRWSGPFGKPRDNLALDGMSRSLRRLRVIAEERAAR
ncbi:SRPBCC family protein [Nocardia yamanashiensis]|uniref:SRPBCC family protein n=1 Tax=Nocardia yamanashiensis TaxID=209247 RepID=UPI001E523C51|nr:SRPBCC family protein [Nocardia yamanashiensis]UGT42514.1 SRPBCC family protein [Nocardia yamanashiensis]